MSSQEIGVNHLHRFSGSPLGSQSSITEKLEQIQCFVDASFNPLAPPLNQHYQHDHEANPRDYPNQRDTVHTLTPSLAQIPRTKYIVGFLAKNEFHLIAQRHHGWPTE